MLICKHSKIQEEDRKDETPWFDGRGGVYYNPDAPCHKCGGKLDPCQDYGDEYFCEPCGEKYGSGSVFHQPGNCEDCQFPLTKQPEQPPTYECKACIKKNREEARKNFDKAVPVQQLINEIVQSMGYKDNEDYELSVIREVSECGKECVWWQNRNRIIADRLRQGKSLTERSDGNSEQVSSPQEQISQKGVYRRRNCLNRRRKEVPFI